MKFQLKLTSAWEVLSLKKLLRFYLKVKIVVKVEFLGPINKESIELNVTSLKELSNILKMDEDLKKWLPKCSVAINDKLVSSLDINLKNGDKISLLPPVCGG